MLVIEVLAFLGEDFALDCATDSSHVGGLVDVWLLYTWVYSFPPGLSYLLLQIPPSSTVLHQPVQKTNNDEEDNQWYTYVNAPLEPVGHFYTVKVMIPFFLLHRLNLQIFLDFPYSRVGSVAKEPDVILETATGAVFKAYPLLKAHIWDFLTWFCLWGEYQGIFLQLR